VESSRIGKSGIEPVEQATPILLTDKASAALSSVGMLTIYGAVSQIADPHQNLSRQ